jgi:hypothetical protein
MSKLGKYSLAIALGLIMSLSLFTSGVFAQSLNQNTTNKAVQVSATTSAIVQHANVQQTGATFRGPGYGRHGFYGGRHFYHRGFYGGRHFYHRNFYGGRHFYGGRYF